MVHQKYHQIALPAASSVLLTTQLKISQISPTRTSSWPPDSPRKQYESRVRLTGRLVFGNDMNTLFRANIHFLNIAN